LAGDVHVHKVTVPPGTNVSCHPLKYSSSLLNLTDPDPNFTGKSTWHRIVQLTIRLIGLWQISV